MLCWLLVGALAASASETITLRVQAIRLTDDDGGRPADTSPAQFSEWVEFANASFAPAGIAFAHDPMADFAEVRSTFLNNLADPNDSFPDWRAQGALGNEIAAQYPGKVLVVMRHGPGPTSRLRRLRIAVARLHHPAGIRGVDSLRGDGASVVRS